MGEKLSDTLLTQLSGVISESMGLHFPQERWRYLEQGIVSATGVFGFDNAEACAMWLMSTALNKSQIETLAGYLTVGETYFFRENKDFEIFEKHIFSALISSRQEKNRYLRIWCAGCATGEEPYSIAILLHRMLSDFKNWHITILATDINTRSLRKAAEGIYTEWSFRNTPEWVREGYFKKSGKTYEILPQIKNMVTFSYLNLIDDAYPALLNNTNAMDIILCRNVLMYFSPDRIRKVAGNFYKALVSSGWLIVTAVEASRDLFPQYANVNFGGNFFYRKEMPETGMLTSQDKMSSLLVTRFGMTESGPQVDLSLPAVTEAASLPQGPSVSKPSLYEEALSLYERGFYEVVIERLQGVGEQDKDALSMSLLAKAYANQGKLAEALMWCEKAIIADKLNVHCYYLRATILHELGQVEGAIKALKQAIYLEPEFVLAYFALGNFSRQQGKFKEADRYFENTVVLLSRLQDEEVLQDSEGITVHRLREIIDSMRQD